MSGALLSHFRASALGRALIMTFWYLLSGAAMTFIVAWSIAAIDPDLIRIESNYAVTSHEKPPDWDQYAFDDGRLFWMVATRRAPILTYHVWVAKFAYDPKEAQQSSEVPRLGYIRYVRTDEGRQQSWESVPIMPTSTPRPAPHHLERMFGVLGVRVGTRNIHAVTLTSIYGARVHGDNILLKYYGWPCHALGRAEQWRWNGLVLEWGAITPPGLSSVRLPYLVHPRAAIFNVCFWAVITFLSVQSFALIQSTRRRRRGHCPRCNYDLVHNLTAGCPECGWNKPSTEPHAPPTS